MVKSTKSDVVYPEKKNIESTDDQRKVKAFTAPIEIGSLKNTILLAFGGILDSTNKDYKYTPLYLTSRDSIIQRIGCYEFHVKDKDFVVDSNGDFILENLHERGEFLVFQSQIDRKLIEDNIHKVHKSLSAIEEESEIVDNDNNQNNVENENEDILDSLSVSPVKSNEPDLYTDDIVFTFYAKSADVKPGKGVHEKMIEEKAEDFKELEKIKNWRRVLSNYFVDTSPEENVLPLFEADTYTWASVEHYFQAQKFKKYPDYYRLFTIESDSEISKSVKLAKEVGDKGKLNNKIFVSKQIRLEIESDTSKYEEYVERGQLYKYSQHEFSKQVLLATKNAKLQHLIITRKKQDQDPIIFYDTMRIRQKLKNQNSE